MKTRGTCVEPAAAFVTAAETFLWKLLRCLRQFLEVSCGSVWFHHILCFQQTKVPCSSMRFHEAPHGSKGCVIKITKRTPASKHSTTSHVLLSAFPAAVARSAAAGFFNTDRGDVSSSLMGPASAMIRGAQKQFVSH